MNQPVDIASLLRLRKLTRAVGDYFRNELNSQLRSLQPLFKPTNVLGEYVRNAPKQTLKTADASLKELRSLYMRVGHSKPFHFEDELQPPIDLFGSAAELTPVSYSYTPRSQGSSAEIIITSPLKWVLSYKGLGPGRLQELLMSTSGSARIELQACLLHYLVLHIILSQEFGVAPILRALRFAVTVEFVEALGGLPMVYVAAPVSTRLPADEAIIQSTELSGASAFEEIIDPRSIERMSDPLRDSLVKLIQGLGEDLSFPTNS